MKLWKRIFVLALAAAMLLSAFGCSASDQASDTEATVAETQETAAETQAQEVVSQFSLQEIGSFNNPDGSLTFYDGTGVFAREDTQLTYISLDGTGASYTCVDIDAYTGGVCVITEDSEEFTSGILKDGNLILDCEAAIIKQLSDRYYEVYYATNVVWNEDDAIFYTHEGSFSLSPSEGDTLYAGYTKVFDVERERFVPGLQRDSNTMRFEVAGPCIVFVDYTSYTRIIYDADGNIVLSSEDYSSLSFTDEGIVTCYDDGVYTIYTVENSSAEQLFHTSNYIATISGTSDYFMVDSSIVNRSGAEVLNVGDNAYVAFIQNILAIKKDGSEYYGLYTINGAQIYPDKLEYYSDADYMGYGYYSIQTADDTYSIYGPNGMVVEGYDGDSYNFLFGEENEQADAGVFYIVSTWDTVDIVARYSYDLGPNGELVAASTDKTLELLGLFDPITGVQLLDCEYDDIQYANGYIYARSSDVWTVYKVDGLEGA